MDISGAPWFRLTAPGQRRFATIVLNVLNETPASATKEGINITGTWVLRLCNDPLYRWWIPGMQLTYTFDPYNYFTQRIELPMYATSITLQGEYWFDTIANVNTVEFCFNSLELQVKEVRWRLPYTGGDSIAQSFIDNDLWIGKPAYCYSC